MTGNALHTRQQFVTCNFVIFPGILFSLVTHRWQIAFLYILASLLQLFAVGVYSLPMFLYFYF
jgi:hypothetical protein